MELFEFSPEVVRLIGTILQALGVIIVVVASIRFYAKYKEVASERDETQNLLELTLDSNYMLTKDYARVTDNNSALIKQINELKVRVSRTDQPHVGGKFTVKKSVKVDPNIGKYECVTDRLTNFKTGNFYERYKNKSTSNLIMIGDNRLRSAFSPHAGFFRLVKS